MKKKNKEIIIITLLTIIFIVLSLLIITNKTETFDNQIHQYILNIRSTNLTTFFKIITNLGSAPCLITIIILTLIKNKKLSKNLVMHLIIGILINLFIKAIFARTRPIGISLIEETGYSYPSGHSMISLIFYGYILSQINKSKTQNKLILNISIIILILLIGLSRVYLGVHYITDIIGGFTLASIYLLISKNIKTEKKWSIWKL